MRLDIPISPDGHESLDDVAAAPWHWQTTRERFSADFAHPGQEARGSPSTLESQSPGAGLLEDIPCSRIYTTKNDKK